MITQWRLFLTALRFCTRLPAANRTPAEAPPIGAAVRFLPLVGVLIGAAGGAVYWVAAQIWPTSIAVILSMLATEMLCRSGAAARGGGMWGPVFAILIKYNALMALSAANTPFPLPANVALGLIMIAAAAASRALVVSAIAAPAQAASKPVTMLDLCMALALGFAPAVLLGLPGLIGLAGAIGARIAMVLEQRRRPNSGGDALETTRQLTEVCFYLAALATWAYI